MSSQVPPGPQNIFWKIPCTLGTHQKFFDKIDFWAWKCIFQASRPSGLEKTHFWAKFKGQKFFTNFVSWPNTPEGASIGANKKISRADFWLSTYFLKKVIFCILMLKKLAKSYENPSFFAWKNRKKFKIFIFRKMLPDGF